MGLFRVDFTRKMTSNFKDHDRVDSWDMTKDVEARTERSALKKIRDMYAKDMARVKFDVDVRGVRKIKH